MPAASAARRDSSSRWPLSTTIGIVWVAGALFRRRVASQPVDEGHLQSRITRSGASAPTFSDARVFGVVDDEDEGREDGNHCSCPSLIERP